MDTNEFGSILELSVGDTLVIAPYLTQPGRGGIGLRVRDGFTQETLVTCLSPDEAHDLANSLMAFADKIAAIIASTTPRNGDQP